MDDPGLDLGLRDLLAEALDSQTLRALAGAAIRESARFRDPTPVLSISAGDDVNIPANHISDSGNQNPPSPSPSLVIIDGTEDASEDTRGDAPTAVSDAGRASNDDIFIASAPPIVAPPKAPERRRHGLKGGRKRASKPVRAPDHGVAKRQLAPRAVPFFDGSYRVPVTTTTGEHETIEWVHANEAGIPVSAPPSSAPPAPAAPATESPPPVMTVGELLGQPSGLRFGQPLGLSMQEPTGPRVTRDWIRDERLKNMAQLAQGQLQKDLDNQNAQHALEAQQRKRRCITGLDAAGGVLAECNGKVDALFSDLNRPAAPRFETPHGEMDFQMHHTTGRDSPSISTTPAGESLHTRPPNGAGSAVEAAEDVTGQGAFVEDHSGDPLVPPPVDDAARMKEFMFRFDLDIGRTPPHKIRLLKVLRSSICLGPLGPLDLDKAKYELFEFDYEYGKRPSYVAISYVWGDESETSTISINGADVQVRTNLVQALASIRAFDHETYIWVDSVCINQEDKAEKAYMVAYMAPIFACASFVYAFLGPTEKATPHSSSDDLFRHLKELGELFWAHARDAERGKLTRRSLGLGLVLERSLDTLFKKFRLPPGHQDAFPTEEYWALSTRPFWSRIWVIQEVFMTQRLTYVCGKWHLESRDVCGAAVLLEAFQHHVIRTQGATLRRSSPLEPGDPNEQLRKFALAYPSLAEMHKTLVYASIFPLDVTSLRLAMTNFYIKELPRGFRATDPRDMVFALLGFTGREERAYVNPDYTKSVQEVYTATTRSMILHGFTDILAWAQPEMKKVTQLPSWVPDFSATIYESLCSQGQAKPWLPQFKAGGKTEYSEPYTMEPFDSFTLPVFGVRLDAVMSIGNRWFPRARAGSFSSSADEIRASFTRSAPYAELRSFLETVRNFVLEAEQIYARLVAAREAGRGKAAKFSMDWAWRVPCCDQIVLDGRLVRGDPSTQSRYEATLRGLEECVQDPEKELPADARPYVEALLRWADKRPFLTERGLVGLGPASMARGDTIAVMDGFAACYLVRLRAYAPIRCHLVGEAYVAGIMDGEMTQIIPSKHTWFHLI